MKVKNHNNNKMNVSYNYNKKFKIFNKNKNNNFLTRNIKRKGEILFIFIFRMIILILISLGLSYLIPINPYDTNIYSYYLFTTIKKLVLLIPVLILGWKNLNEKQMKILFTFAFIPTHIFHFFLDYEFFTKIKQYCSVSVCNLNPNNNRMDPIEWRIYGGSVIQGFDDPSVLGPFHLYIYRTLYDITLNLQDVRDEFNRTGFIYTRKLNVIRLLSKFESYPAALHDHHSTWFQDNDRNVWLRGRYHRFHKDSENYRLLKEYLDDKYDKFSDMYIGNKIDKLPMEYLPGGLGGPLPNRPDMILRNYEGKYLEHIAFYQDKTGENIYVGPKQRSILDQVDKKVWQEETELSKTLKEEASNRRRG